MTPRHFFFFLLVVPFAFADIGHKNIPGTGSEHIQQNTYLYDHPAGDKEDLGEGMGSRVVWFSEQQSAAMSSSSQQQQQQAAAGASNVSLNGGCCDRTSLIARGGWGGVPAPLAT